MSVLLIVFSAISTTTINRMDPRKIDIYPNYLWVYALHHYLPQSIFITVVILLYSRNSCLVKFHKRQYSEFKSLMVKKIGLS